MSRIKESAKNYRWFAYLFILFAYILGAFQKMGLQAVKMTLESDFGINALQYSNLSAAYFYGYAVIQIPSGIMADVLGPKKTSIIGTAAMAVSSVIYGLASGYVPMLIARALMGLGSGVLFVCILKIISVWFDEKEFGTFTGLTSFSGNMAGCIAQAPLAALVGYAGWKVSFTGIGILSFIVLALIIIFAKDRPEDMGFPPVSKLAAKPENVSISEGLKAVFSCPYTYTFFIVATFCNGIYSVMTTWAIPYFTDSYGLTVTQAGAITFFLPMVAAFTNFGGGWISDKIKLRKIINIILAFVCVGSFGVLAFAGKGLPLWAASVCVLLLGTLVFHSINYGPAKDCLDYKYSGMVTSTINTGCFIGGAIFPTMFGNIISRDQAVLGSEIAYGNAFRMSFVLTMLLLITTFFVIETNGINHSAEIKAGTYKKSVLSIK